MSGHNGESIVFDGNFVSKFKHDGKEETAKNPASTYRQCDVKPRKRKKRDTEKEQEYDVMLAMSSFMTLTIGESAKHDLDSLIAALEAL